MARKLNTIVVPLKNWLSAQHKVKLPEIGNKNQLSSPLLEVCRRRGEAILVTRFYEYMAKSNITNPEYQLELWDVLLTRGNYLYDLASRIGLIGHFSIPPESQVNRVAYIAWCIFIDSLKLGKQHNLLHIATNDVFNHFFIGMFPKTNSRPKKTSEGLKMKAANKMCKIWGIGAQLKESFATGDDSCQFSIRFKTPGKPWETLITVEGKRLKPTRLEAYTTLLQEIESGKHRPEAQ